jgi:hypothetical protein
MTFVSRKKLQRFVCTLSAQLTGFFLEESDLGLDRIGFPTEENSIGSIRSICHGDNRLDNVQHQVARFEFARSRLSVLGVERKIAKRVNLGGMSTARSDGVEMVLEGTSASFAANLLNFSGAKDCVICGGAPEFRPSCGLINQIWKLMDLAPGNARFSRVQSCTQGMSILNRYITFRSDPGAQGLQGPPPPRLGHWSAEELQKLR